MKKVLNLYSGIGGNRKLWINVKVTAIETNSEIAEIYQNLFPDDEVIITDAHQYLLEHYNEFDFIWTSPPCPSHSRMRNLKNNCDEYKKLYPDMKLYEEIIFLKHFFKGKFVVENVISYYDPLIKPFECENHYFWSNFNIGYRKRINRNIRNLANKPLKKYGFDLTNLNIPKKFKYNILNNLINPFLGLYVFECAYKNVQKNLYD